MLPGTVNMDIDPDRLAWLLQTSDPLFPSGAYAHSLGLEEVVRLGVVRDEASLRDFLQRQIVPALERFELPMLRRAHDAARQEDLAELAAVQAELDAWKIARELREASLQLGTRRLQTLRKVAPCRLVEAFVSANGAECHHIVACALQFAQVPCEAALTAYFYGTLAGCCGAALKLIRIGQEGCQRVLRDCLQDTGGIVSRAMEVPGGEAGWFNPLLEIASMRHERAWERLFIS